MLGEYDFHLFQVQHIKSAMDQLPTFRPLSMTPARMQLEYDSGMVVRTTFQDKFTAEKLVRESLNFKAEAGHQAAIGVYGVMKTRYRNVPAVLQAILGLPIQDRTVAETRVRMEMIKSLWEQLPNDPYRLPPGPLVAWPDMGLTEFGAMLAELLFGQTASIVAFEEFELAQGMLHEKQVRLAELASSALQEGRGQFVVNTPGREVIDSIPTQLSAQAPNQAVITVATSPGAGAVHLEYDALHATSFDVFHKAPGATEFTLIANDTVERFLDVTGLVPGSHQFTVIGQNSRGSGPESEVATVVVT